jgi:hypothetical protein
MKFNFRKLKNSLLSLGLTATLLFPSGLQACADGPTTLAELKQAIAELRGPHDANWVRAVREICYIASQNGVDTPLFDGFSDDLRPAAKTSSWPPSGQFYVDHRQVEEGLGICYQLARQRFYRAGYNAHAFVIIEVRHPDGTTGPHRCSLMTTDTTRLNRRPPTPGAEVPQGEYGSVDRFVDALRAVPSPCTCTRTTTDWLKDLLVVCAIGQRSPITAPHVPVVQTDGTGGLLANVAWLSRLLGEKRVRVMDRLRSAGYKLDNKRVSRDELRLFLPDVSPLSVRTWSRFAFTCFSTPSVPPGSGGAQPDPDPFGPQPAEDPPGDPSDIMSLKFMLN